MIFVVLNIALVNLGIGFALALYLGYGPPGIKEAWDAISFRMPKRAAPPAPAAPPPAPPPAAEAKEPAATEPAAVEPPKPETDAPADASEPTAAEESDGPGAESPAENQFMAEEAESRLLEELRQMNAITASDLG